MQLFPIMAIVNFFPVPVAARVESAGLSPAFEQPASVTQNATDAALTHLSPFVITCLRG